MKTKLAIAIASSLLTAPLYAGESANILKPVTQQASFKGVASSPQTLSGMSHQYDSITKEITFKWATVNQASPNLTPVSLDKRTAFASDFYLNQLVGESVTKPNSTLYLAHIHAPKHGSKIVKYKQQVGGIEVFNKEFNILMDQDHNLVASSGTVVNKNSYSKAAETKHVGDVFEQPEVAILSAVKKHGIDSQSLSLEKVSADSDTYHSYRVTQSDTKHFLVGTPRAKPVYFEVNGNLEPSYYIELQSSEIDSVDSKYMSYVIGKNGKVLFENNLVSHAGEYNYRAYISEDGTPWDSPHGNVIPAAADSKSTDYISASYLEAPMVALKNAGISTDDPWLEEDAEEANGNNVHAYADLVAPDGFTTGDLKAEVNGDATFDYPYNPESAEYSVENRKAAIVNLFLVNNFLHDDYYAHGFDEASGNAQLSNYDRGGVEGDPLRVEVQDNSGFNNANMSTPADGASPRMQMYLWDKPTLNGTDFGASIVTGDDSTFLESTVLSALGPVHYDEVKGKIVRLMDTVVDGNTNKDGCDVVTNAETLEGNIALIDRGACSFIDKILNAQNAGAIGVIVANNADGSAIRMGGDDPKLEIQIPNIMISKAEGMELDQAISAGDVTISMFSNKTPRGFKASSWDNGIVAHEWGHYISNRLVGNGSGLVNNQGRSMGEGWGDFHALLLLAEEDDAMMAGNDKYQTAYSATSYVANFQTGIRRLPYSTDTEVNNFTFAEISNNAQVHASGTVWATMLWDAYVGLINDERHTFAEAQSLMKTYIVSGYKMTPIAPTFTEARDAILAVAYANDPEDYTVILKAFAARGLGLGAVSPERFSNDHAGAVESYDTELAAFNVKSHALNANYEGLTVGYCSNDNIMDKGETGTVSFTIKNTGNLDIENIQAKVKVTSEHDVTFANAGAVTFSTLSGAFSEITSDPIEFSLDESGVGEVLELELSFMDEEGSEVILPTDYSFSTLVNMDFEDQTTDDSTAHSNMEDWSLFVDWQQHVMHGGEPALVTQQYDNGPNIDFFETFGFDLGDQVMVLDNNDFQSDVAVETREFTVGFEGDFEVNFWHFYAIEQDWDGGVVEISVNGSDWVDVTEVGGSFDIGYDGPVTTQDVQALSERPVFHGRNNTNGTVGNNESINFGTGLNGSNVKLRFRIASDAVFSDLGWWIDNVSLTNVMTPVFNNMIAGDAMACDNRLPNVTIAASGTDVKEGDVVTLTATAVDANAGDELSYSWKQTVGNEAALSSTDGAEVSFTAPEVSSSVQELTFELTVNDGTGDVVQTVEVKVRDIPEAAPEQETKKKKSSGSLGWLALVLTPFAVLRRRRK
ncbi:peptidase M36 [Shewanella sp. OPT22]|nr:peptidase M36 [Shewanella sp. OPT22]